MPTSIPAPISQVKYLLGACSHRALAPPMVKDDALAQRINALVETFLTSDDDAKQLQVLAHAKAVFQREGIPSEAKVGDAATPTAAR